MNMRRLLFVLPVICFVFFACGGGRAEQSAGSSAKAFDSEYKAAEAANNTYIPDDSRKFIITASLTLRLDDLKNGEIKLNEIMDKYNAYIRNCY